MNQDEVKRNVLSGDQWLRMLLMVCYLVVAWVVGIVLVVVMVAQTLVVLITAELNLNLQRFGAVTSAYLYQIVMYLVYGTDEKPFPFSPLPPAIVDAPGDESAEETIVVAEVVTPDTDNGTQNQV
ncbi:MAG TPA: DUF4389 domain-containing protein [Pseudomonadales bacterium]